MTRASVISKNVIFFCLIATQAFNSVGQSSKEFTSWLPAPSSDDALLIGNGIMGAMVFGHPHDETIILNEASIYLPTHFPKPPIDQASILPQIRRSLFKGNGVHASQLAVEQSKKEGYEGLIWNDPYIPAFDLKIKTSTENILNYKRSVNYKTGEATVTWTQKGNSIVRKQFISRADSVFVLTLRATAPFNSDFTFARRPIKWNEWNYVNSNFETPNIYAEQKTLVYSSEFKKQWDGNIAGYYGVGEITKTDGTIIVDGSALSVKNAKEIVLLLKIESYVKDNKADIEGMKKRLDGFDDEYDVLLEKHTKVHGELFNRVSFTLNKNADDSHLDSEVMMLRAKRQNSNAFVEKLFYASRYNILCATGLNPPNLQGIWGSSIQPPWASDYTHDGNLPMAMSSFLSSNMKELMMPFFDYHDARVSYYKDNAKKLYGCRGIQVPSHTSSHGWNSHFSEEYCLLFWNGGAAWTSHFYYDYWLYTEDFDFLKNRAYPFMKETALFYEDFLIKGDDGKLIFNPSYSPENHPKNHESQATINATMDVALAKELLRNVIIAGELIGEKKKQLEIWKGILDNLPSYELDSTGTLREWIWPGYIENHHHRHISHLYGLYDMIDPEIGSNSLLLAGAKNAVEKRMAIRRQDGGGIMVFGLAQMAAVAANLEDNELYADIIHWLSSQYWSNSLASFHDPNGLFNMDLSGGYQNTVIKSLIYSEPGFVSLLPAIPAEWETGEISGLKLRGNIELVSLNWTNSNISVKLKSLRNQKVRVKLPQGFMKMNGKSIGSKGRLTEVALKKNSEKKLKISR